MEQAFFNPYQEVSIHERNLPHWQQPGVMVFLTWRLADSLPERLLSIWREELAIWRKHHPEPWDDPVRVEYRRLFSLRLEGWLDAGHGTCALRHGECRDLVQGSIRHFDGRRYSLLGYVIMPNHIHLVVRPFPDIRLEQMIQGWKSWSAREINRWQGSSGRVWQTGYWDRLLRDQPHLDRCLDYIRRNPVKANLPPEEYTLWIKPPENAAPAAF